MAAKKSKKRDLEKEHAKIAFGSKQIFPHTPSQQQWSAQGDFFTKFSLYRETSSGLTSANTHYVK